MKSTVSALAVCAIGAMTASAGQLQIGSYLLADHPDGNQNPPPYGLRVDDVIAAGVATLSIDFFADTVLTVFEDDVSGDLSINIQGTLWGGAVSGGSYVTAEAYTIDMNYVAGVEAANGGWRVNGFDAANTGVLTRVSDNTTFDLFTTLDQGRAFIFAPDGHRLSGDDSTFVGRGWVTDQSDGTDPYGGARDWLFTVVPAPSSALALAGMGLVAARRRR